MPLVEITLAEGRNAQQIRALLAEVHAAVHRADSPLPMPGEHHRFRALYVMLAGVRGASPKCERERCAGASRMVSAWGACASSSWPIG